MDIIHKHRLLLFVESLILFAAGSIAITLPVVMTLSLELLFGILFLITGAYQIARAIEWREHPGGWIPTVINLISYIAIGILLLTLPMKSVMILSILLSVWFIVDGITKVITGPFIEHARWYIYSGILAIGLAFGVWFFGPETSLWVFGVLVGVNMLFFGLTLILYILMATYCTKRDTRL